MPLFTDHVSGDLSCAFAVLGSGLTPNYTYHQLTRSEKTHDELPLSRRAKRPEKARCLHAASSERFGQSSFAHGQGHRAPHVLLRQSGAELALPPRKPLGCNLVALERQARALPLPLRSWNFLSQDIEAVLTNLAHLKLGLPRLGIPKVPCAMAAAALARLSALRHFQRRFIAAFQPLKQVSLQAVPLRI